MRVHGDTSPRRARRFFEPLARAPRVAGLGHLPEICDGDPPHAPCGCPFQAWSLAELLRLDHATQEDVITRALDVLVAADLPAPRVP